MASRSNDRIPPQIYPWWLILVGFIFGVIVTLVVTHAHPQTVVIHQPSDDQRIWLQATQLVHQATMTEQSIDSGLQRPTVDDAILQTATAIVRQATQQAPPG